MGDMVRETEAPVGGDEGPASQSADFVTTCAGGIRKRG